MSGAWKGVLLRGLSEALPILIEWAILLCSATQSHFFSPLLSIPLLPRVFGKVVYCALLNQLVGVRTDSLRQRS